CLFAAIFCFFHSYAALRALHSFPTRRSSDLFMNRTELVARELSLLLNRTLREHSDLVLDLRDIRGNPFTGFRAVEPRVRFRDGATLVAAREMRVDYSAWGLVFGRGGEVEVTLERPEIPLVDAQGAWRLRGWRWNPSRKGHGHARELQIHLRMRDAHVIAPAPYGGATGVTLDLAADLAARTRARLEHLRWEHGPWDSRLEEMIADLSADSGGGRVRLSGLRTSDLEVQAPADRPAGLPLQHAHVVIGRVRWRWLAQVFDNHTFDVPGEGSFVLDADGAAGSDEWRGRFRGTIDWDGL